MDLLVTVTLSDRLFALLEDKLPNLGRRVEKAITKEISAQTRRESSIEVTVNAEASAESAKSRCVGEDNANADETVATVTIAEKAPGSVQTSKEVTPEQAREALKAARARLLGDGYESQKGTAVYKSITAVGKEIIMNVSAGRATNIPDLTPEERERFITACESISLGADGFAMLTPPVLIR